MPLNRKPDYNGRILSVTIKEKAVLLPLHSTMFLFLKQVKIPLISSRDYFSLRIFLIRIPAIKWGIEKEDIARSSHVAKVSVLHQGFECKSSGLVVNCRYPHLGASPDGLINCDCCFGEGILPLENAIQLSYTS